MNKFQKEVMKKLFISQPMSGLTDKEILEVRQNAIKEAIEFLADADVVYFARVWSKSRGCKIEQICAKEYGIECIYSLGI